ncbi:hypothetical protein L3X38_034893 [Prunus dulcis]|uniref:Uncharacterized protein n=1 Tax=Prunus dulcis TaxID=3755 RepID=A0AAD4VK53_PRUDU|nr:hypothetical protein L3X38_034893 [Prunus dulcis]
MIPRVRWPSTKDPLLPCGSSSSSGNVRSLYLVCDILYRAAVFLPVSALIAVGYIQVLHTKENKGTFILSSFTSIFTTIHIKTGLFAIPMCITFILLGVVSSMGNTFFIEQAVDMNHYVGSLWIPILILPGIQGSVRKNWGVAGKCCAKVPKFGIAMSTVFATLCCITAAKVKT